MPTSATEGKSWTRDAVERLKPSSVLDVGVGDGTYSKLLRSVIPESTWIGVEAFAPYVEEFNLYSQYDTVLIEDVRGLELPDVDLIIMGDVLEHMTRLEATLLVARAKRAAQHVIVSIPVLHLDQGAVNGNEYERHIDHWTFQDMYELLDQPEDTFHGEILGVFLWSR